MKKVNIFLALVIAVVIALLLSANTARDNSNYSTLGGDCSADRATGDLYVKSENPLVNLPDPYCLTVEGTPASYFVAPNYFTPVVQKVKAVVTEATRPNKHKKHSSSTSDNNTTQADPTRPAVTATQAPPSVQPTDTPAPPDNDDKECKNKNAGKDGTPAECNAGIGQEKHD